VGAVVVLVGMLAVSVSISVVDVSALKLVD
jgi:hypothetical protein